MGDGRKGLFGSPPGRARPVIAGFALVLVIAVLTVTITGCGGNLNSSGGGTTASTATASAPLPSTGNVNESVAGPVAQALGPSVVNIKVGTSMGANGLEGILGTGSGVIYTADGYIITNNHVVTGQDGNAVAALQVTLVTGVNLPATIVGRDPTTDLAVIKVTPPNGNLPPATFVAALPAQGDYAIAIGSPLGFENSVTLGIVSGLGRSLGATGTEGLALSNLIQTDAPISPGNSGGALGNASGQVIGINAAYLPPGQTGAVSLGFAIPAATATSVAEQLIKNGKVVHGYLGVGTVAITPELAQQYNLAASSGLLVAEVPAGTPAAQAGLQQGDIITKVDGQPVAAWSDLAVYIRDKAPGDKVQLTVLRNGAESTITATLGERPTTQ
jgi:S1-C subfamily serine protease